MGFFDWARGAINKIPIYGGVASAIWGDPSQEAHQESFQKARGMLDMNRADQMDSRMNAMNQGALAFGPRNQMLGEMMGKGPGQELMNLDPMLQNPMTQGMQDRIRQQAFGRPQAPGAPPPMAGQPGQPPPPNNVGGAFTGVGQQNPYRRY